MRPRRPYSVRPAARGRSLLLLLILLFTATACDLFSTRSPEPPIVEGGTFLQPDTPDQVIANIQAAIGELNTQNYRRSFAPDLEFEATGTAQARDPAVWTGWSRAEEERYFRTLAAAARLTNGNELRLNDRTLSVVREDRFVLDATYVLTVFHRRPHLSETAQGRLVWVISQAEDGLWYVSEWTDQELSGAVSWSDLKAEFVK